MAERLKGKVAVITGGASGMGRETVLRFLAEGAQVVFGDLNEANAQITLDLAGQKRQQDRLHFIRTDVSIESQIEAMVQKAVDEYGRLDCMFNNAGVVGAFGPITHTDINDWDRTQAILLRSVFLGIKHAARVMKRQGSGGSIINTASVAGLGGGAAPHAYSAAKAGVVNLSRTTATELAEFYIRVNAICPGLIVTPLVDLTGDGSIAERAPGVQPLPVAGAGSDVASMACFLASDDSRFCTGQPWVVDGGLLAAGPSALTAAATGSVNEGGEEADEIAAMMRNHTGMIMSSAGEESTIRPVDEP